ncbi:MAG TPA: hypothetical protein VGM77_12705 [Gemmatimonadales bacterium]
MPWWVWCVALLLHVPLVWLAVTHRNRPMSLAVVARPMALQDVAGFAVPTRDHAVVARRPSVAQAIAPANVAEVLPPEAVVPSSVTVASAVVDTPPSRPDLRPHYGDGRLWVAPLPATPRELAQTLSGKTASQLADSAVAAMVQAYLDQMAADRAEHATAALPSWTTKIAGKTVGIDQRWIYLGKLKIPTVLLALLPLHITSNPTEAQLNAKLQVMRDDLFEAARRAANYDDFKNAIKTLHEQTERDREFKRNQRIPPDTSHHA